MMCITNILLSSVIFAFFVFKFNLDRVTASMNTYDNCLTSQLLKSF